MEKGKYCDLHTHSIYSDGTVTPRAILDEAERLGLSAVALTDHNTTAGLTEFLRAAQGKRVKAVSGVEFSTDYGDGELHILGLFLKPQDFEKIEDRVAILKKNKAESNAKLVENLRRGGFEIDLEQIKSQTPNGHINRAHIAAALAEKGYVKSIREAFETLLKKDGEFYVQTKRLDAFETVAFIKELGGVAVLAHPFLDLTETELIEFLKTAKPYGLDGMETRYSTFDDEMTATLERIAAEFGLLCSGGSDFHGERKPDIALGVGRGALKVPTAYFETLYNRFEKSAI
ncbi:MAG: PHP domain-containing protein [Clostridia bacterium]|nr:PHP domain-containing protein [Clostridia bacterium]